ncbi:MULTISPECIES: RGCVC family protein [unclassified Geodermatophilus]|uniref:RGCVC family protein n=1 Tax=unclassified Geodermatophilus TaxID=2637632 RepID=UPI003F530405
MAAPGPTHHYPAALRWSQAVSAMTSSTIPMTTSTDVRAREQASLRDDAAQAMTTEACDVCPHPRADHDAIAARFCSATGTGAIARGCVCRS